MSRIIDPIVFKVIVALKVVNLSDRLLDNLQLYVQNGDIHGILCECDEVVVGCWCECLRVHREVVECGWKWH